MKYLLTLFKMLFGMEEEKDNFKNDRFEFYLDKKSEWRWRRKAGNNKIISASSEGFINRSYCIKNAQISGYKIPEDIED